MRGPDTVNVVDPSKPWAGNMLNDYREALDAGSDQLRATDEDRSGFTDIGEEGEDAHEFLEPGDLVSLFS